MKIRTGHFYNRLIAVTLLFFCIPTVLAGIILYYWSINQTIRQFINNNQNLTSLAIGRMEKVLENVERDTLKLSSNNMVRDSFLYPDFGSKSSSHLELLDEIIMRKNFNDYIKEIYYYNSTCSLVLSSKYGGYILSDYYRNENEISQAMKMDNQSKWMFPSEQNSQERIIYYRLLPVNLPDQNLGLISVELDTELLKNYLYQDFSDKGSINLIFDNENRLALSSSSSGTDIRPITESPSIKRIFSIQQPSGSFFSRDSDGKSKLFTYIKTNGRVYVSVISRSTILEQEHWSRWFVVITCLGFLGCGIFLALISSKRVYNPIRQLINYSSKISKGNLKEQSSGDISYINECLSYLSKEVEVLNDYIDRVEPTVREEFLKRLLEGKTGDLGTLKNDCRLHGIPVDCLYVVSVAHIDNIFTGKDHESMDKPIINYTIANIMKDKISHASLLDGFVINNKNEVISILCLDEAFSNETAARTVNQYFNEVLEYVKQSINISVTFGIGRICSNIIDISVPYKEASLALKFKLYRDRGSILHIDELEVPAKKVMHFYPIKTEKEIIGNLIGNNLVKAEEALNAFVNCISESESYNFIYESYQILLSSIIIAYQENGGDMRDLLENNLSDQLKDCKTFTEIFTWFVKELFPLFIELRSDAQKESGKSAILTITKYIDENIMKEISLIKCSELVNMSPSHISRLFRNKMGVTFLDYIMNRKIEEIKRLLTETDYSVNDIANIMGYSRRNIYRVFFRLTGMSPAEYRTQSLEA